MEKQTFTFDQHYINTAFTYEHYRREIHNMLQQPETDEAAAKMRPYIKNNSAIMDGYEASAVLSGELKNAIAQAPAARWVVITEGWCGDAAFNLPLVAALEKAVPEKVQLRIFLRDTNLELMDAYLTDGGRSIPKLIVLSKELEELGVWGPRPEPLQTLMKEWKAEGLGLKELIPKIQSWYDGDQTKTLQQELITLIRSYS